MVKSSKGFHSRTRGTLTKEVHERGMPPITKFLQTFETGSRVIVRLEASDTARDAPPALPGPRRGRRSARRPRVPDRVPRREQEEAADRERRCTSSPAGPTPESHA